MFLLGPWESCCLGFQKLSCVQDVVIHYMILCWKSLCWMPLIYLEFRISCCSSCLEKFHSKETFYSLPLCIISAVSFTALSFRMCLKNVIFILTPAGIFLCSIPHFCLRYCIWHQLYPLIFIIHCWTPYFMQNYVHFVIVINPIQSCDTL